MKKFTQIIGLTGVLALALGGLILAIQQRLGLVAMAHLAAGAAFVVLGALANVDELRQAVKKQSIRLGPQALLQGAMIVVILFFLNVLVYRHDWMKDFTLNQLYTLQKATREVMASLPGKVEVIAFFPGGGPPDGRQRLELYAKRYPKVVNLRFVDPDKNPDLAQAENIPHEAGIKFKYKNKSHWINSYDEGDITNAFIIVSRAASPTVWFTSGHAEPLLSAPEKDNAGLSRLNQALKNQGFELKTVDLATVTEIPTEVSVLAIVGPAGRFSDQEMKTITDYISRGGNVFMALDPLLDTAFATGLEPLLESFGVSARGDLVFDPQQHMARDTTGIWIVASDLPDHEITTSLTEKRVVFYLARTLEEIDEHSKELYLTSLVKTSGASYNKIIDPQKFAALSTAAEKDKFLQRVIVGGKDSTSRNGPFILAYAVSRNYPVAFFKERLRIDRFREGRLVVTGTSTICRNLTFDLPYNYEFVISAMNWLAGEKNLKGVQSPQPTASRLDLDEKSRDNIILILLFLPELFTIIGLAVWWRRR